MIASVTINTPCPKCGCHANRPNDDSTWRGPVYHAGMDVGTTNRVGERLGETLEFTCKGCGFKTSIPCKDKS